MRGFWHFVFVMVMLLVLFANMVYVHERVHGLIYEYYGCENIEYSMTWSAALTSADCALSSERWDSMILAHSQNEIITYNIVTWLVVITWYLIFVKR